MYFRSSSQTKSPCGSSSGERNSDAGRQTVGGPNKDNQTVSVSNDSISGCVRFVGKSQHTDSTSKFCNEIRHRSVSVREFVMQKKKDEHRSITNGLEFVCNHHNR